MQEVSQPRSRPKVLVVDDNADVLDSTVSLLEMMGFDAIHAESAYAAIELARATKDLQALVTDFSMPEMNGAVLVDKVAALHPSIRAVITSGLEPSWIRNTLRHPALVLAKPYDVDTFVEALGA